MSLTTNTILQMNLFSLHTRICILVTLVLCSCGQHKSDRDGDDSTDTTLTQAVESSIDSLQSADNAPSEDETASLADSAKQIKSIPVNRQGLHIYISKPKMHLFVLDSRDSVIYSCGIACGLRKGNKSGKGDYRTPEGNFSINGMFNSTDWVHRTRDGRAVKGCYGPRFLRLATGRFSGIGIHGTNSPGSIGHRASEGCIRVNSANIMTLFNKYAYDGMPVVVSTEDAVLPNFKGLPAFASNVSSSSKKKTEDSSDEDHNKVTNENNVSEKHEAKPLEESSHETPSKHKASTNEVNHSKKESQSELQESQSYFE